MTTADEVIRAFEQAWQQEPPPALAAFVASVAPSAARETLLELAAIDMEFRWQAADKEPAWPRPGWHVYVAQLTGLASLDDVPPEFIAEEYRVRQVWGDQPTHDEFMSRYPRQFARLPALLQQIDRELRADGIAVPSPVHAPVNVPPAHDPRAPLPWSDYVLEQHLGTGGFGRVYRAWQKSLERPVAVKALLKSRQHDPQAVDLFVQEARLLARLQHPGIVGVHGLGRFPSGGYFLVLDLVAGHDLQQRLATGPLSAAEACPLVAGVAAAIHHAHQRGIVHGDLKPSNVLVTADGRVTVTDFGLAQLLPSPDEPAAQTAFAGGTAGYLAPELLRGEPASIASDVYGIGALLHALVTGSPPPQSPDSMPLPNEVAGIICTCLAPRPADRFTSAGLIATALANISQTAAFQVTRPDAEDA